MKRTTKFCKRCHRFFSSSRPNAHCPFCGSKSWVFIHDNNAFDVSILNPDDFSIFLGKAIKYGGV